MSDTCAACLTPAGSGAIAVIAVRGPAALAVVQGLFSLARSASEGNQEPSLALRASKRRIALGTFANDQVILTVRDANSLELHCHGGRAVVSLVLETLAQHGIATCTWQDLERRTDPARTDSLLALTQALTVRTAAILLRRWTNPGAGTSEFLGPWRVAIAGAPNVGKSSLLNALAGYQRSIVSPIPGTTRDVVAVMLAIDGWPVELLDTAGQRSGSDALEAAGIQLAEQTAAAAHLCLWVLDGAVPPVWPTLPIERMLVVINKTDLPPAWDFESALGALRICAATGAGLEELCRAIVTRLVPDGGSL